MAQALKRRPLPVAGFVLVGVLGAVAALWLWNRRGEAALHRRTAERLRPLGGSGAA